MNASRSSVGCRHRNLNSTEQRVRECVDQLVHSLVVLWQVLKVLKGHTDLVNTVVISTDGAKIVSGSWDETVRIWSMETGEVAAFAWCYLF
jgi:WD40 repeat protein